MIGCNKKVQGCSRPMWTPHQQRGLCGRHFLAAGVPFYGLKRGGKSAGTSSSSSFFGSIFVSALVSSRYLVDIIYICI